MQIITQTYTDWAPLYPIEEFCPRDKALFIDIETTGLSKETTSLYLIGCGYYCNNDFCAKLFFADNESEELEILNMFLEFSGNYTHLIHFNGTKFDIPYLQYKAKQYKISGIFDDMEQVDIYQICKPLRNLLFPQSMRQKCIEDFLGITRNDKYNGGELISVYHSYVLNRSSDEFDALITHNLEDVLGMHKILPLLHYMRLLNANLTYISSKVEEYEDYNGIIQKELYITYSSSEIIPSSFSSKTNSLYLWANAKENTFTFRLPIITGEMKLFFDNYRDYYYLPNEDSCIHKSVAMGLSKSSYIKATRSNCYIRRNGEFIKQPTALFTPVFKSEYKDKSSYFSYPDSFEEAKYNDLGKALFEVFIKPSKTSSVSNNKKTPQ